jgi:segregation and condensation protein B
MSEERFQLLRLIEAILFASADPMSDAQLRQRMPEDSDVSGLLAELQSHYANRGVHLMHFDGRYAFRTAPDLGPKFHIEREVQRKLSRAAIETLAIIAYHQPVTRAEIEEIRGVVISRGTLDTLLEAGWIKPKGRRQTPGRPVTWATTEAFLEHFGLESCEALPGLEELRIAGLLDQAAGIATLGVQALPGGGGVDSEEDHTGDIDGEVADDAYDEAALERLGASEPEEERDDPEALAGDALPEMEDSVPKAGHGGPA